MNRKPVGPGTAADTASVAGLGNFVLVTEIAEGQPLADPLFRRKYASAAPPSTHGHHIFALLRCDDGSWTPASYINYLPFEGAMLIGGACTDGCVLATLPEQRRDRIRAAGGLMMQTVRYGERRFADRSIATFGHCGDARSWSVLERCGYQRLDHPYLVVRWNREPTGAERAELIARIEALGEF